jgi:hypothetical protein
MIDSGDWPSANASACHARSELLRVPLAFEPAASLLAVHLRCGAEFAWYKKYQANSGADKRGRTADLRVTSALLYQLSYVGLLAYPEQSLLYQR